MEGGCDKSAYRKDWRRFLMSIICFSKNILGVIVVISKSCMCWNHTAKTMFYCWKYRLTQKHRHICIHTGILMGKTPVYFFPVKIKLYIMSSVYVFLQWCVREENPQRVACKGDWGDSESERKITERHFSMTSKLFFPNLELWDAQPMRRRRPLTDSMLFACLFLAFTVYFMTRFLFH